MAGYNSLAVFLFSALALIVASGFSLGAVMLVLGSALLLHKRPRLALEKADRALVATLLLYFAVNAAINVFHGAPLREYDAPLRFLLAVPALLLLLAYPPQAAALWAGLAAGAVGAGGLAIWQRLALHAERSDGSTNAIQYGNISIVLGILCLAGLAWALARPRKAGWTVLLALGAVCGVLGAVLSGSRGSWIALPFCVLILAIHYGGTHGKRYVLAGLLALSALAALLYALPQSGVRERGELAVREVQDFIRTGNADTSVGARLEMWRSGLAMVSAHPWLGWGKQGYMEHKLALIGEGKIAPAIGAHTHLHNEYLDALLKRGAAGLLATLALFLVPLTLFWRALKHSQRNAQPYALGGVLLYVSYLLFGLTQAFLTHNNGVMILGFLTAILWSALRGQQRGAPA